MSLTHKISWECYLSIKIFSTGHVFPGTASNIANMQVRSQLSSAFFIPDEMRSEIYARNEIANFYHPNLIQGDKAIHFKSDKF